MKDKTKLNFFLISDASGETVATVAKAVVSFFETEVLVTEYLFPMVRSKASIDNIIENAGSLKGMFDILTSKPGIGEYYGYHCATSNSVNPYLPFHHDESFCAPGPGARESLENIFDKWTGKKFPYADMVVWLRDNQERLFERINIHPHFHNFEVGNVKVFEHNQNNMKVYGTEVGLCQYGVYCWLKANPHLISKRKIARVNTIQEGGVCAGATLNDFIG
jgi:hypothetical protein